MTLHELTATPPTLHVVPDEPTDVRPLCRPLPPSSVRRARLVRRLTRATTPLATLVAPAGYGKTTLLQQWAEADARPVAWIPLTEEDNDPVQLLAAIAARLDEIAGFVPRLAWALEPPRRPMILVLDDAHLLREPAALDALRTLSRACGPRLDAGSGVAQRAGAADRPHALRGRHHGGRCAGPRHGRGRSSDVPPADGTAAQSGGDDADLPPDGGMAGRPAPRGALPAGAGRPERGRRALRGGRPLRRRLPARRAARPPGPRRRRLPHTHLFAGTADRPLVRLGARAARVGPGASGACPRQLPAGPGRPVRAAVPHASDARRHAPGGAPSRRAATARPRSTAGRARGTSSTTSSTGRSSTRRRAATTSVPAPCSGG